jgi:hypothetical protein
VGAQAVFMSDAQGLHQLINFPSDAWPTRGLQEVGPFLFCHLPSLVRSICHTVATMDMLV